VNKTGDPVFDEMLRRGLSVELEQSPLLQLIPDSAIHKTLTLMEQDPHARLTPELAQEVCQRTGSAAALSGSIETLGKQYVLWFRATNCDSGKALDEEQVQFTKKEDVLDALSQVARKFRTRIGESLATIKATRRRSGKRLRLHSKPGKHTAPPGHSFGPPMMTQPCRCWSAPSRSTPNSPWLTLLSDARMAYVKEVMKALAEQIVFHTNLKRMRRSYLQNQH
jgi:hypothetical protein